MLTTSRCLVHNDAPASKVKETRIMKLFGIVGVISAFALFSAVPAAGHGCCHHDHQCGDCGDCGHYSRQSQSQSQSQSPQPSRGFGAPSGATAALQTLEGKIAEVVYLPGATAGHRHG